MHRALALGWLLAVGGLQAEAPLDLASPFHKTAIVETRLGQQEEFEVLRAIPAGENLEMTKLDGSILLAPRSKVVAILPKLPSEGFAYTQKDAQEVLGMLETASRAWPDRPETSPRALAAWRELAARPSSLEQSRETQRSREVQRWLEMVQPEEGRPRPVDLQDYVRVGERLVQEAGPQAEDVKRQLQ